MLNSTRGVEEPLPDLEKLQELLKKHEARLELKEKPLKTWALDFALGCWEACCSFLFLGKGIALDSVVSMSVT